MSWLPLCKEGCWGVFYFWSKPSLSPWRRIRPIWLLWGWFVIAAQYIPYRHGFGFNLSLQFAFWVLTLHFASILCNVQISHVGKFYNISDFKLFRFQILSQFSIIYSCLCMVQCAIGANIYIYSFYWFIMEHCLSLLVHCQALFKVWSFSNCHENIPRPRLISIGINF
jgi:hypothetical protein